MPFLRLIYGIQTVLYTYSIHKQCYGSIIRIKTDLQKMAWGGTEWIALAQNREW
jgi:hypothetical protein